jgi:cytochrome c oxidase cbb3-type subunit 1
VNQGAAIANYADRVVTAFTACAVAWAVLGMAVGVYVAAELVWPTIDFGLPALSFGRLRTLHTTLVLFGFGVSALIATALYSVQRTSHVRLFAPGLAWLVFYAWQIAIVLGAASIMAGWNGGKEYGPSISPSPPPGSRSRWCSSARSRAARWTRSTSRTGSTAR